MTSDAQFHRKDTFYQRSFARSGNLSVRLARSNADLIAAQKLRYKIFYQEMSAQRSNEMRTAGRDFDQFDAICDHVLVIDEVRDQVVGTYRLLRGAAIHPLGFYSATEFDLAPLLKDPDAVMKYLELGRSCIHMDYRSGASIQLMWRAIGAYLKHFELDVMFGCASLFGEELAQSLSYLHHCHSMDANARVSALPNLSIDMNRMPLVDIDKAKAQRSLPPLLRGYLKLGATIGQGAVRDEQFGTTDVFLILPLAQVPGHMRHRFGVTVLDMIETVVPH
jgi:putative hemolysin